MTVKGSKRRRSLRRGAAVAAVAALGALAVAACGGSSTTSSSATTASGSSGTTASSSKSSTGTVNLTLWHQDTGTALTALTAMVNGFNSSQSKYKVTPEYIAPVGTSETAFTSKLATALSSGSGPNLVWSDSEPAYVPQLIATGKVVDLNSLMSASTDGMPASDFVPAMLATGTFNNQVYALPCDGGDYAVFYNKAEFKKAGITSTPTTWAQLASDAKKLTSNGDYGFYVPWGTTEWTVWTWESMLWSEGGQLFNANNTKATFDTPQGVAALQVWLNMLQNKTAYPSDLANATQSSGYPGFQTGKVAMYIDGSYDIGVNDTAMGASNVGVFAFPATKTYAMNTGTNMALMFKGTTAQEAGSWAFMRYALSAPVMAKYDATTGFLPTVKAVTTSPAYVSYTNADPRLKVFANELNYAHSRPSISGYEAVSTAIGQQLESAFLGKTSAADALKTAQTQANQALAASNK